MRGKIRSQLLLALTAASLAVVAASCGRSGTASNEASSTTAAADETARIDPSSAFLAMAERHARAFLATAPEAATELGVSEEIAGEGYLARLGGYGFAAHQAARALNEQFLQELRGFDRASLSGSAAITYDVLKNAYDTAARRNQFDFGGATPFGAGLPNSGDSWAMTPYFMTQLTGPHLALPRMLMTQHPIDSAEHVEAYLARLGEMSRALDEAGETFSTDAGIGDAPPRFAIEGILTSLRSFTAAPAGDHPLVATLREKMANVAELSDDERTAYAARAARLVEEGVYPAYERLASQVELTLDQTNDDAGVWRLGEEGEAYYQLALTAYGAGYRTGDDVHELGLSEVARISAEMDGLLKSIGLENGSVAQRMTALAERPDNLYPNTDEGREALLTSLRGHVAAIMARSDSWFGRLPDTKVEVRRIPVHEQDSSPGGYYTGPSLAGSRPGVFWINLKNTADNPKHSLKSLTFHEAVPGHHFQTAYQRSIGDMPLMRNMLGYSEYAEGWALYAESLAKEMGMYEGDPEGDLGRLQAELFRAARLVVDTGLHHKKWTREQAIDYMTGVTGDTRESVTREIERYAVVPGQACAYKLGMLKFQELRAKAETELGDSFDIREFHDIVLSIGDAPLPVLESTVNAWIKSK
ncbi:MAG: DUF885 domain-containing protein [Parvularculaceae bacterium]|nr:DUF885 domain-containing protein [Parvularculaceae bacterium]